MVKLDKSAPSLADALVRVRAKAGKTLRVDVVLGLLDATSRDTLTAWLHDPGMAITAIEGALAEHASTTGTEVTASYGAIAKWRKANGIG